MFMRSLSSLLVFLGTFWMTSSRVVAQEITPDDSFTFDLCLPNAMTNLPYQKIMQGLVHASMHYQYASKSGLYVGAGTHYSYFAINEFRVQPKVYGGIHSGALFLKTGHEKFWSERFGTDIGLRAGYVRSYFISDALENLNISPILKSGLYLEPNVSLILTADVNQSFRLTIGYPIYAYGFSPDLIGIEGNLGYDPNEFNRNSSFLSVGFGFTYYFNGKKSTALED